MDKPSTRKIYGIIALSQSSKREQLKKKFFEEFEGSGGNSFCHLSDGIILQAENFLSTRNSFIANRHTFLFWNKATGTFLPPEKIGSSFQNPDFTKSLLEYTIIQSADDSTVIADLETSNITLLASCAGSSTFFYTQQGDFIIFSNSLENLKAAKTAPTDPLGLAEIVRFGSNYTDRTILKGIKRIPFAHCLEFKSGSQLGTRCYSNFNYQPDDSLTEKDVSDEVERIISRNLSLINGDRDLLYSGGVDSILLAHYGIQAGSISKGWFYSMGPEDSENFWARSSATKLGLDLGFVENQVTLSDINKAIASYSLPTLDFSIIPTYALGTKISNERPGTTFIDGTGGDAWLGFGSLGHARTWNKLNHFQSLTQPLASFFYSRLLQYEGLKPVRLLKVLSRLPVNKNACLGHLSANPVYRQLLQLPLEDWISLENDVLKFLKSLTGGETLTDEGEVIVSDATMIAVAGFSAKTGQWNLNSQHSTLYPFLMPNMTELGRKTPFRFMLKNGLPKPILKNLVSKTILGEKYAHRSKSGFQPPLQTMLEDPDTFEQVQATFRESDDTDAFWSDYARQLPTQLLRNGRRLGIGGLYSLWSVYAIKRWLKSLRGG